MIAFHGYTIMQIKMQLFVFRVVKDGKVRLSSITEQAFLTGFTNWKDATRQFAKHEKCEFHKSAVASLNVKVDVAEMLSKQVSQERKANRDHLMTVLSTIRFLARQGLPLRGGDDKESNFY